MIPGLQGWYRLSGFGLFLGGILAGSVLCSAWSSAKTPVSETVLDNTKVQVNRVIYEKHSIRSPHTRPRNHAIALLDDARYNVTYANGKKEVRERKSGDVIWHEQGEEAPTLTNAGTSYRTVVINLK
jgi:hypothetical protein